MASPFSAAPSALGYLFQVRLALLLLLDADYDGEISVEVLDDLAFEKNGQPVELLQLRAVSGMVGLGVSLMDESIFARSSPPCVASR